MKEYCRTYSFSQDVVRAFLTENKDAFIDFMLAANWYTALSFVQGNKDLFDDFVLSGEVTR